MTMSLLNATLGWILTRAASGLLLLATLVGRAWSAWIRRGRAGAARRRAETELLTSLFDVHPAASTAPRRTLGLRTVPIDRIVGTMRHPSQNTADFRPLPRLRGRNWSARWQRINRAMDRLETLPPVELVQAGDDYYVADGHNRVAAARRNGAVEIDADVTQLLVPGVSRPEQGAFDASSLYGAGQVRQAASGRLTRTIEQRPSEDRLSRQDLLRGPDEGPR
jgi:hypothetical protein